MKRAYIAYVPEYAAMAAELCGRLEEAGVGCWIAPRDVSSGSEYHEEIRSAIASCPAFVLLLTAGSNQSMYVRHELEHAVELGKRVFVVRAESVVLDSRLEPLLSSAVDVDVADPPRSELCWNRLVDALADVPDEAATTVGTPLVVAGTSGRTGRRLALRLGSAALAVALVAGVWALFAGGGGSGETAGAPPAVPPSVASGGAGDPFSGPGYDPARAPGTSPGAVGRSGAGVLEQVTRATIDAMPPAVPLPDKPNAGAAAPRTASGGAGSETSGAARTLPICPRSFALIPEQDEAFECACEESAMRDGLVWGTGYYALESKLCRAALHAGIVEATGGPVIVEWGGARDLFVGTERNGVETGDERAAPRSARFRGAEPLPAGPGPCPATFAMLPGSVDSFDCVCAAQPMPPKGSVWGTDVYQDNSSLCLAAVHAGAITVDGGPIAVERVAGREPLLGSERNGVASLASKSPARSMRFR